MLLLLIIATENFQQNTRPTSGGFFIQECRRDMVGNEKIEKIRGVTNFPSHCFMAFFRNGEKIASRGFFQDAGSTSEPDRFEGFCQCRTVRTFSAEQEKGAHSAWRKVTETYGQYSNRDYNLVLRNCCHITAEALNAIGDENPQALARMANCSLAGCHEASKEAVNRRY